MLFSVELNRKIDKFELEYEWNVSSGEIIEGQGTSQIKVLSKYDGVNITATIKIKGLPENCLNTVFEIGSGLQKIHGDPYDKFYGKKSRSEELFRIDSFFMVLKSNPRCFGFILIQLKKGRND